MRTAHPIATKLSKYIPLVILSTWLNFGEILSKSFFFSEFLRKISNPFFPSRTFYLPYLRSGCSNWCETKRKWVNWMLRWLGYLWPWVLDIWPWILKVKLYLGNGRPDCHGTKGTGVDGMPWCGTLRKWVNWTLHWLGYLDLWPWILKVKLYLGNGRPDCHGTKGTDLIRCPDVKHNH